MALIICSECGKSISSNAAFCPHCGNPKEKQEKQNFIICDNCGKKNKIDASFCGGCGNNLKPNVKYCEYCGKENEEGAVFCKACGNSFDNTKEKNGWNFYSTFLTITFLLSAIFGTIIFSSERFRDMIPNSIIDFFLFSREFLFGLTISIAVIILLVALIKDGFSIRKELDHLKHFKLSKIQASIVFIISGLIILLVKSSGTGSTDIYFILAMLFILSFLAMTFTTLVLNYHMIGWILDGIVMLLSIGFFVTSIMLFSYGNEQKGDWYDQAKYFLENGRTNPGEEYITWGTVSLILGFVFLIIFIILMVLRVKNKKKKY